jgi:hypothetical protein
VKTDRTIHNNKPDIIIRDNEKGSQLSTDTGISTDKNMFQKEAENILKYKELTI